MKVRALRHSDALVNGRVLALFDGQIYDLPDDAVLDDGAVEAIKVEAKAQRPVSDKAVKGPDA